MKNILFIMLDLGGGGAEKSLIELLKSIDYTKHKVSLCLFLYRGVYLNDIPKDVRVISLFRERLNLPYFLIYGLYRIFNKTWLLSLYMRIKTQRSYDVIISSIEGFPVLLHSLIVKRGGLNISWIHCDFYNYHYTKDYFRGSVSEYDCYKMMDKLVFVSKTSMNNFDKLYKIDIPKYCIYNILDIENIKKQSAISIITKQHFTITSIGSLIPIKGFDRLIRVAKMLKDSGYSFLIQIIGDGVLREELIELRNSLDLHNDVLFFGFQNPPFSYLKQSDIFVSTSISEGLPYVICEALVLEVPVVATKTAGSIELLGDNVYGLLTEHDDMSIFKGVKSLIDDLELQKTYKERSRDRVKFFAKDRIMDEFSRLINE